MAEQFYTILTNVGKAKVANSLPTGTKVNLTKLKIGDSNGTYYNPSETQTDLVHKVYECNVTSVEVDEDNPSWVTITAAIPSDVGGFMIREVGVFDDGNNLIAIGKYPETYKPVASDGSTKELYIKMTLEITNSSSVELKIDPTVIIATKKDIQILDNSISSINASLSDMENIVNRYKGKKYVAVGDSITYGFVDNPYSKLVGQILGMNYVNMGVSGSLITVDPAKTDSIFERRSTIPTDADVISIFGGTNDFGHTVVDMGMFGDTTYNLGFYGTVYALCQWLLENRPNAKIFFITPLPRGGMNTENTFGYILEDYVNAIIDVCNYWSIPVLDFYHDSALSPLSNAIAAEYYDSNKLHPLQNGHNLLANKIIEFMRGI